MRGRMPGWIKRDERDPVSVGATVHLSSGRGIAVTIVDVSAGGCKLRGFHALPIGEIVQLEIPAAQPQAASVRWVVGGLAGLRFV